MIIHVFTGDRTHLVPTILKGFFKLKINQLYLVFCSEKNERLYNELFKEYNIVNYVLVSSWIDFKKKTDNNKIKKSKIILHGVPYSWMWKFIVAYKDVNWICWGAGAKINYSNWKSVIFTPIKKIIYRRFNKIGVLMPQDEVSLKKDYGIKETTLLSYFGSIGSFPYSICDLELKEESENKLKKVYLGNNSSSLKTYLSLTEKLSKFKEALFINCMINYTFKESEASLKLREVGSAIYRNNFFMDETLYSLDDYYKYMNECDIYICNVKSQSGLGAIFTCLRLGKKVFLSGINYEFIKSLGAFIYHVDEIDMMSKEDFVKDITYEHKVKNFKVVDDYLNKDMIIKKWQVFLKDEWSEKKYIR